MNDLPSLCEAVSTLNSKYGKEDSPGIGCREILAGLGEFIECVRYLNTRRSGGAILKLESEADVQDAIYIMLRPWVHDLIPESPGEREANRYTIKDFVSKKAKTIVEAKYIRDKEHGKSISKELHDDIENYRHHPDCRKLIFFVYDRDALIPDQGALKRQIETERTYGGVPFVCYLLVKP
jgi:hypothetical protein